MSTIECPNPDQLMSYTNGNLVESESEELFGHIQNCSTCLLELQQIEQSDGIEDSLVELLKTGSDTQFDRELQCRTAVDKAKRVFPNGANKPELSGSFRPSKMGDYEIVRLLGQGGMGTVYLANHEKLGRQVALKVLAQHRLLDQCMQERFSLEMRAIGALSHPNIVTAFDAREIEGTTVLVTEYIDGLDLGKVVNRLGKLSIPNACQVASVVARALAYTDERGFVHRDIKPSNVMLSSQGMIKVLDLGLARIAFVGSNRLELTVTGQAMGSPDYVAPEQINDGRAVDGRTDLYSLGCTLFKMLSGKNVFDDEHFPTSFAKLTAHVSAVPPSLKLVVPDANSHLVRLVDSMLEKDPDKRPKSAEVVADALEAHARGSNLLALIDRALKSSDLPLPKQAARSAPLPASPPQTKPSMERTVPVNLAIGGGLLGIFVGLFFGIIITITNPDGSKTKITVPDGSHVAIETADKLASGQSVPSEPSATPKPAGLETTKSSPSNFLKDNLRKTLPTLKNVTLFSNNKPGKLTPTKMKLPVVEPGEAYLSNFSSNSDSNSRISPILMLDAKSKTVAVSTSPMQHSFEVAQRSQIFVGQLPLGPFKEVLSTELPFALLDHDLSTGQSLGVLGEIGSEGDRELVLFDGLMDGNLREVFRQRLPFQRNQRPNVSQAKIVALNQVIVAMNGVVYGWDLSDGSQLYQTDPRRMFQSKVSFSPDRTLMTLVDTSGVHIADAKTGADLGFIRLESRIPSCAPFDRNANRIALCSHDAWSVYDLETLTLSKPQTTTWKLDGRLFGWIGPDLLLAENGVVLHTKIQTPVWKFHTTAMAVTSRQTECALWEDSITYVERQSGLRLRTLAMPHDKLQSALKSMPAVEDMLLTGPGTKVRLELKLPEPLPKDLDPGLLRSKMIEIIQKSDWEVVDNGNLKLVVQIAAGRPFSSQYISYSKPEGNDQIHSAIPARPVQTPVEITPLISTLELRSEDELVWFMESSRYFGNHQQIQMFLNGTKQKTKEEFIDEMQRAHPEFFYEIFLPKRIAKQPYTHGLGASREQDNSWVPSSAFP